MRILLWHVHGGWTDAFVRGGHDYLFPTTPQRGPWGLGRAGRDWPANAREVAPKDLPAAEPDVVVLQRPEELAQVERLLGRVPGRSIPAVYLEHNTPKAGVPNSVHALAGQSQIPILHVTHFNDLLWDNGAARHTVIEHGIVDPGPLYSGESERLAVVINEPIRRGRVTGTDLLPQFAQAGPLEVFGMRAEGLAAHLGLTEHQLRHGGDLPPTVLHARMACNRAYLHPMRWTSLGLSLLEAMHLGMPVIALGSTEAFRAVPAEAGAISSDVRFLVRSAERLLADPDLARNCGRVARETALARYGLDTFLRHWDEVLEDATSRIQGLHSANRNRSTL